MADDSETPAAREARINTLAVNEAHILWERLAALTPKETADTTLAEHITQVLANRLPLALGDDGEDDEQGTDTFSAFEELITPKVNANHVQINLEDFEEDLQDRINLLACIFAKNKKAPATTFNAITDVIVREGTLPFESVMDYEDFQKLLTKNKEAIWIELKARAMLNMANWQQQRETFLWLKTACDNLQILHEWVLKIKARLEKEGRLSDDHDNSGDSACEIHNLKTELKDAKIQIATLQAEVNEANSLVTGMAIESRHTETRIKELERAALEATPGTDVTGTTASSATKASRTAKLPDPDPFHNEKDKDKVEFDVWFDNLKDKLEGNSDHYPTDRHRLIYIKGRLSSTALRNLHPYFSDNHPDKITTSKALLDFLYNEYHDYSRDEKALSEFNDLVMKSDYDFMRFKNDFVRLAGECRKDKKEWKREFNRRLPKELKTPLAAHYIDDAIDFDRFVRIAQEIAFGLKQANSESRSHPSNRAKSTNNTSGSRSNSKPTTAGTQTTQGSRTTGAGLSKSQIGEYLDKGLCFKCGKPGHLAKDCADGDAEIQRAGKAAADAARKAKIAGLHVRWGDGKDDDSAKDVDQSKN